MAVARYQALKRLCSRSASSVRRTGTLTPIVSNPEDAILSPEVSLSPRRTQIQVLLPAIVLSTASLLPAPCSLLSMPARECPDESCGAQCGASIPHCHHQRSGARKSAELCAAVGAVLRRQPWHGHSRPNGEGVGLGDRHPHDLLRCLPCLIPTLQFACHGSHRTCLQQRLAQDRTRRSSLQPTSNP